MKQEREKRGERWKMKEQRGEQHRWCVDRKMGCDKGVTRAEKRILMKESPGFAPVQHIQQR